MQKPLSFCLSRRGSKSHGMKVESLATALIGPIRSLSNEKATTIVIK